MRKAKVSHRFGDAMQAKHPVAYFAPVKVETGGEQYILLAIADNVQPTPRQVDWHTT